MTNTAEYVATFVVFAVIGLGSFVVWRFIQALRSDDAATRMTAKRRAFGAVLVLAGCFLLAAAYNEIDLRIGDAGRFAERRGREIRLHPSGIFLQVPEAWVDWDAQFHNNFHLTHRELRSVRLASGEWDSEYATVVNAALPFEDCAAHIGGEGWGRDGVSFGDLQMRAYVTTLATADIIGRIRTRSMKAAETIAERQDGLAAESHAAIETLTDTDWQHARIQYPLWYGDYGGTARIDFFVKNFDDYRLVMVFMGPDADHELQPILASVRRTESADLRSALLSTIDRSAYRRQDGGGWNRMKSRVSRPCRRQRLAIDSPFPWAQSKYPRHCHMLRSSAIWHCTSTQALTTGYAVAIMSSYVSSTCTA